MPPISSSVFRTRVQGPDVAAGTTGPARRARAAASGTAGRVASIARVGDSSVAASRFPGNPESYSAEPAARRGGGPDPRGRAAARGGRGAPGRGGGWGGRAGRGGRG